jgi:hypothetical protein
MQSMKRYGCVLLVFQVLLLLQPNGVSFCFRSASAPSRNVPPRCAITAAEEETPTALLRCESWMSESDLADFLRESGLEKQRCAQTVVLQVPAIETDIRNEESQYAFRYSHCHLQFTRDCGPPRA